jgi:hypothetical protein
MEGQKERREGRREGRERKGGRDLGMESHDRGHELETSP